MSTRPFARTLVFAGKRVRAMTSGRSVCLIVAGSLIIADCPAAADAFSPGVRAKIVAVAEAHWPQSQCRGREIVQAVSGDVLDAAQPTLPAGSTMAQAMSRDGSNCTVQVGWDRMDEWKSPPVGECVVLEHEFGHLSGLDHSPDPGSVMFADINPWFATSPDCAAAFRVRKRSWWHHSAGVRRWYHEQRIQIQRQSAPPAGKG